MSNRETKRNLSLVLRSLNHRNSSVRWAAAGALGRASLGETELIPRLKKEHTDFVIAEIADSLAMQRSAESLDTLKMVAARTRPPLARGYCLLALGDIAGQAAVPILQQALTKEVNPWAAATIQFTLAGIHDAPTGQGFVAHLLGNTLHRAEHADPRRFTMSARRGGRRASSRSSATYRTSE
jgi:HEAT repeat protein